MLLAHPDSPFPSPWYLLALALGAPFGLRVQVVLFMIFGATGMAALLRRWNTPTVGCFVGAVIFIMSAHFALHIAEGHLEWCALGLMPWLMLCLLRFSADLRFVIVAALLLASILTFGSVYILAVYIPFLSVWSTLESIRSRSWRLALGWGGTVALAVLLSAVKLLPQLEFVHENPRHIEPEGFSPIRFVQVFLDPQQALLNQATHEVIERLRLGAAAVISHEATDSKFESFAEIHCPSPRLCPSITDCKIWDFVGNGMSTAAISRTSGSYWLPAKSPYPGVPSGLCTVRASWPAL